MAVSDEMFVQVRNERELAHLKEIHKLLLADCSEGMECLPGCDQTGHAEHCPVAFPAEAFRKLRRELGEALDRLHWFFEQFRERRHHPYADFCDCMCCSTERLLVKHGRLKE